MTPTAPLTAAQRIPGRPVRFDDPARNAAYWARIDAIVDQAPPFTTEQRAIIRSAFHQPKDRARAVPTPRCPECGGLFEDCTCTGVTA